MMRNRDKAKTGSTIILLNIAIFLMIAAIILYIEIKSAYLIMTCYEHYTTSECTTATMSLTYILVILNTAMIAIGVLNDILSERIAIAMLSIIVATSAMASFPSNVETLATIIGESTDLSNFAKLWFTIWFANFGEGLILGIIVIFGFALEMVRRVRALRQERGNLP